MLQCIIIDDEPMARKGLEEYIHEVEFLHLAGAFDNPLKAADILVSQPVDLIFLDIQMPKMTGLDFYKVCFEIVQWSFLQPPTPICSGRV